MKELKHLHYFEGLLQKANNELIKQAQDEGNLAIGYTCYFVPEVLMNLPGCFSVRLRAPNTLGLDVSTFYMTNKTCQYSRSILERAIEGGYNFLDALNGCETCSMMHRIPEHVEMLNLIKDKKPSFYTTIMDVPFVNGPEAEQHYEEQLYNHILKPLQEVYEIDISDEALMKAIDDHNEISKIISEIGDLRKTDNPPITGYEFHVIQLVSEVCPHYLIKEKLSETLEEIKKRKPDQEKWYRTRIVLAGGEIDNPKFTKLIEDCGAFVVADRYCYGSLPGREQIVVNDGESPLHAISRHYLNTSQCPRFMNEEKRNGRKTFIADLVEKYHADGVLIEQEKFCEYWIYERIIDFQVLNNEMDIPTLTIEKEYQNINAGQLRTRIQAFVESLEMKKSKKEAAEL